MTKITSKFTMIHGIIEIPGESGWVLDVEFREKLITELSNFSISKAFKRTVE